MYHAFKQITASPSKSFAAALVCFALGVAVGPVLAGSGDPAYYVGTAVVGLVAWAWSRDKRTRLVALLVACFAFGIWRYGQAVLPPTVPTVADEVGHPARVTGVVASEVEQRSSGQRAVIDDVRVADAVADGKVLVSFPDGLPIAYGDTVTFNCALDLPEPIEGFRYDRYLRSQGVLAVCYRPQYADVVPSDGGVVATLLSVKRVIVDRLAEIVPEPHGGAHVGQVVADLLKTAHGDKGCDAIDIYQPSAQRQSGCHTTTACGSAPGGSTQTRASGP